MKRGGGRGGGGGSRQSTGHTRVAREVLPLRPVVLLLLLTSAATLLVWALDRWRQVPAWDEYEAWTLRVTAPLMEVKPEPMDLVLTWVNGSDRKHAQQFIKYTGLNLSMKDVNRRFNEYGTLRFALRSVQQYMPFVRRVFLVTNGQVPYWWNYKNERARLVKHEQLFMAKQGGRTAPIPRALPTFNSNAIEANLHNIPGVSRRFVYLNDDMVVLKPLDYSDFVSRITGQMRVALAKQTSPTAKQKTPWDQCIDSTNALVNSWYHPDKLDTPHHITRHAPYIFDRDLLRLAAARWPERFLNLSTSRYRRDDNLVIPFLLASMAHEEGTGVPSSTIGGIMVNWRNNHTTNQRAWRKIQSTKGKSVCIQDKFEGVPDASVVLDLEQKLCALFPEPSPFEDPSLPNPCDKHRATKK